VAVAVDGSSSEQQQVNADKSRLDRARQSTLDVESLQRERLSEDG
jgi:hypothetical protein